MNAPFPALDEDTVELGELNHSVGFLLRMAQTRAYDQFFQEFNGSDVRPGEFTVMWVISLNPGLRQGSLARTLNIKAAHMTKLIARLVRAGLVNRSVPPEDRRSVRLSLTEAGSAHLNRYRASFMAVHRAERVGLTDVEMTTLIALLTKLTFQEGPECP